MQRGYYHNTQPRSGPSKRCSITARYLSSRPSRVLQIFLLHLLSCEQIEKGFFNIVSMLINAFVEVFLLECRSALKSTTSPLHYSLTMKATFSSLKLIQFSSILNLCLRSLYNCTRTLSTPLYWITNSISLATIIIQLHQDIDHSPFLDYKFDIH